MVIGITMIKIVPDHEKAGYDALREIEGVKEIYHLFGEFDLFLILEALDRAKLDQLLEEIRIHDAYLTHGRSSSPRKPPESIPI